MIELGATMNVTSPPGITDEPYLLTKHLTPYTVTIFGYMSPVVVMVTIVTNILVCIVLLKKSMISPTSTFLVAMALSDMFTGIIPLPCFLYFYTLGNHIEYVPLGWCHIYNMLVDFIPTIFHTASIWLTVGLATQRYIYICHHVKAKQWCTIPNTLKGILFIYAIAVMSQFCRFFEFDRKMVVVESRVNPSDNIVTCTNEFSQWVKSSQTVYFNIYFWFRVVFIHLIPCTSLVVLNGILIHTLRTAQKKRRQLLLQNRRSEFRKLKDSTGTTMMLVVVVGVFLLVEVPFAVLMVMVIVLNTFEIQLTSMVSLNTVILFTNFCILLSYPINFFIYCGMSRQFRDTFKGLFTCARRPQRVTTDRNMYTSINQTNGTVITIAEPKKTITDK